MNIGEYFIDSKGVKHQLVMETDTKYYSHFNEINGETMCVGANILTEFDKDKCPSGQVV